MVGAQCVVNLDAPSSTLLNKNKLSEDQIKKGTLKSRSATNELPDNRKQCEEHQLLIQSQTGF